MDHALARSIWGREITVFCKLQNTCSYFLDCRGGLNHHRVWNNPLNHQKCRLAKRGLMVVVVGGGRGLGRGCTGGVFLIQMKSSKPSLGRLFWGMKYQGNFLFREKMIWQRLFGPKMLMSGVGMGWGVRRRRGCEFHSFLVSDDLSSCK